MNLRRLSKLTLLSLFISLAVIWSGGLSALAQHLPLNVRVSAVRKRSITISWDHAEPNPYYAISYRRADSRSPESTFAGNTTGNSFTISGLARGATYRIEVDGGFYVGSVTVTTRRSIPDDDDEDSYTPPPVTCPHLPDRVIVTGYVVNTQCQMVGEVVISSHPELQARGFIDAVDVWSYVTVGLEVCFYADGWLVFLNAAYSPRMATELQRTHRDGMTCGVIERAGTVVLLATGPASAPAPHGSDAPESKTGLATLPDFEAIPLHDCRIKLVETLFLRDAPAGEIIGLVWLNSEVPAFEINGYWYKIEFEGTTGYISRYYREVLRGGCG
ncbi:MAG: hypothetical protein F4X02_11930 [Chloroflexi bacterium]|nr:hypothetical protein [Chloroflexota bacterium]